uniref:PiggyBac transposable element-derived protein domain-containing protein n=1 Tax=Denticeps clupeoides TaxID=299321 RepID=A0AAY4B8L8_9TELE
MLDGHMVYGSRTHTSQALIPEQPQDSDADLSDDNNHPTQEEDEVSFESMIETLEQSSSPDPRKAPRRIWKHEDINEFNVPDSVFEAPDAVKTPLQYFKTLFTDEMIQHISNHTNLYSAQELGDPINCSPELTLHGAPMQEPRRFYKIRPLFEMLRKQCLQIPSTHKHSEDEVMVAYKGTRAGTLRQYIANKPDKWGFKLFCRASSSGIIHDLLLYQGASTFFNVPLTEEEQMLPLGAKVVTTLSKTITEPQLSVVFCDDYFTSFDLIQNLHTNLGVKCIDTVRPNRMGGATLITDKELVKKGCGAFNFSSAEGVLAVKWFDNKCVNLLSNARGIMSTKNVSNDGVKRPAQRSMSHTPAKSRRWYFPLFGYILDLRNATPQDLHIHNENLGQLPLHSDNRGRCSLCPKGVSRWKCQKCKVFLCLNAHQQCFVAYHQK